MESSTLQKIDLNTIVDKTATLSQMIMVESTKEGGMHFTSSTRAISASVKYIGHSKDTYRGNPIVEGAIDRISHWRGETNEKFNYKTLGSAEVMRNVDELVPILESEGEQGEQTKHFLFGLAEAMVSASGSGFMGSGEKVNEGEARFLVGLKAHLNLEGRSQSTP